MAPSCGAVPSLSKISLSPFLVSAICTRWVRRSPGRQASTYVRSRHTPSGIFFSFERKAASELLRKQQAELYEQRMREEAEFVAGCMNDMSISWQDTINNILSMLVYGFSYHEIVYKRRSGLQDDGNSSQFNDGRIGWRKLPMRSQDTVYEWNFDHSGGIEGMTQMNPIAGTGPVFIPIEKALLFRTTTKLNNPRGKSILRSAYTSWYYQ